MQENKQQLDSQSRSWLNKRGITDKIIDAFSISTGDIPHLGLQDAIVIPVHHIDGEHFFNKYRRNPLEGDIKPKYLYDRGGKITLYGADKLVAEPQMTHKPDRATARMIPVKPKVVITEGELDTLVCWSLGIPAVSSTGGALSFQKEWVDLLKNYEVYICFDNDEAGHKGAIKVLELLPTAKVIFVPSNIPGIKDISDYVAHGGNFHDLMKSAKGYTSVAEVEEEAQIIAGKWGDNLFHRLYIEHHTVPAMPTDTAGKAHKKTYKGDDDRLKAKDVDCTTLLEFNTRGRYPVTKCLWHEDHDPSLTYYARNNSCYCHVCAKYADSIDIVMQRDGVTMPQAIKTLINKV
jgi:5S rRNA maturation endonuclease (ribonuclease M5)